MMVTSDTELLVSTVSPPPAIVALLVTDAAVVGSMPTTSVMLGALELAAIEAVFVHVTVEPAPEQLQPVPVPEMNESPAGSVSTTVRVPALAAPPMLFTPI